MVAGQHFPEVSIVLATRNRVEILRRTLERVHECGLPRRNYEVILVDNGSTDGTAGQVQSLCDVLVRLRGNRGSCAKSLGVARARGRFILFLDDDSFPHPESVERMVEHFEADAALGFAGFTIQLPDGRLEGSALPGVFHGAGVGFRAEALRQAGGLDVGLFMQAEEYDLSFRLANAGWGGRVFEDLHVDHLKTAQARQSERTTYFDVRNNLRLAARYLPSPAHRLYQQDWLQRYQWLAQGEGHERAYSRGRRAGVAYGLWDRPKFRRHRLCAATFEHFFRWDELHRRMLDLAERGIRRAVFADLGKNVYAFFRAAALARVAVVAVADDRFHAPQRWYRGIPVCTTHQGLREPADAIVVSNMAAPFATATAQRWRERTELPVFCWYGLPGTDARNQVRCAPVQEVADEHAGERDRSGLAWMQDR